MLRSLPSVILIRLHKVLSRVIYYEFGLDLALYGRGNMLGGCMEGERESEGDGCYRSIPVGGFLSRGWLRLDVSCRALFSASILVPSVILICTTLNLRPDS